MHLPSDIQSRSQIDLSALCQTYLDGLLNSLGHKLFGVYLHGALTFPDGGAIGDLDGHVILSAPPTEGEKKALMQLHRTLEAGFPPLGAELDVYYILLADALQTEPPPHQLTAGIVDNSWALHRAHWLANRVIVLYGPEPRDVYPAPSWAELDQALKSELAYIARNIDTYPDYCVLNLCRLMYSYTTQDVVVSKRFSAGWAEGEFPVWKALIDAAKKSYEKTASEQEKEHLAAGVRDFFDFAKARIIQTRSLF